MCPEIWGSTRPFQLPIVVAQTDPPPQGHLCTWVLVRISNLIATGLDQLAKSQGVFQSFASYCH